MSKWDDASLRALEECKKMATKAVSHANSARSMYNKNKGEMDAVDAAQTLAQVSIAESLSAALSLVVTALEDQE
jgi:hypothetical protein